jgi:hypothetical protein
MKLGGSANVRAAPHIQHRRPNSWTGRTSNCYKHSLGQWTQVMVVGDRECALMCAQKLWAEVMGVGDRGCALMRAQTCAQYHTYSIGAQRAGPIEPQILGFCTNVMGSACAQRPQRAIGAVQPTRARTSAEHENEREAREYRDGTGRSNCREREVRVFGLAICA